VDINGIMIGVMGAVVSMLVVLDVMVAVVLHTISMYVGYNGERKIDCRKPQLPLHKIFTSNKCSVAIIVKYSYL